MVVLRSNHVPAVLLAAGAVAAVGAAVALPAPAQAIWAPGPQVLSADLPRQEQADARTSAVALSGDGRYAVFQSGAQNLFQPGDADPAGRRRLGGVFRVDRRTGEVALVADGDQVAAGTDAAAAPADPTATTPDPTATTADPPATTPDPATTTPTTAAAAPTVLVRGAANPSVSDDGRYVAFQTAQALVPQDTNDAIDVYVRDMDRPLQADRAGSGAYALVSARDGTDAPPAYAAPPNPTPGRNPGSGVSPAGAISADGRYVAFRTTEVASDLAGTGPEATPAGSVFVRDVRQRTTTLVSRASVDGAPTGGATGPISLSADGTTVAWTGRNAQLQARFVPGEPSDTNEPYYLWRRWADLGARTRRITGPTDPDDPGCTAGSTVTGDSITQGPCYGPLDQPEQGQASITAVAPALSGDGRRVVYLTGANPRGGIGGTGLDAWLADMSDGVSRKQGNRQLTADSASANARANGDVVQVAISADGSTAFLETARSVFLLARPRFINGGRAQPGPVELFAVNLAANTMERVIRAPGNVDASDSVSGRPSPSRDGRSVAYLSAAGNLVPGDANQVADAFASDVATAGEAPPALAGGVVAAAPPPSAAFLLRLASLRPARDGSVLATYLTPVPGRVDVLASIPGRTRKAGRKTVLVAPVRVGKARTTAKAPGTVRVRLRLAAGERGRLDRRRRLRVVVAATLKGPAVPAPLRASGTTTLRRTSTVKVKKK